ncbi:hypothetical protein BJV77DRAFT_1150879 [Russula vinacea]|nr:hypothetical protein BJV77DRAFT_1150879 [Russula vinacea]
MHKCTPCLERYHSMRLHDTLCAGGHNEDGEHRQNSANHADPGETTLELHDIIDGITQMEVMLRSLTSPCSIMRVSKKFPNNQNVEAFGKAW